MKEGNLGFLFSLFNSGIKILHWNSFLKIRFYYVTFIPLLHSAPLSLKHA